MHEVRKKINSFILKAHSNNSLCVAKKHATLDYHFKVGYIMSYILKQIFFFWSTCCSDSINDLASLKVCKKWSWWSDWQTSCYKFQWSPANLFGFRPAMLIWNLHGREPMETTEKQKWSWLHWRFQIRI